MDITQDELKAKIDAHKRWLETRNEDMSAEIEQRIKALKQIEEKAALALALQVNDERTDRRMMDKALASIELQAHVARWGCEGYPAPEGERQSPARGVEIQVPRNGEAEADRELRRR